MDLSKGHLTDDEEAIRFPLYGNAEEIQGSVDKMMAVLTPEERQVLQLRFGLIDGRQLYLTDVATATGLSVSQVRRRIASGIEKLKNRPR